MGGSFLCDHWLSVKNPTANLGPRYGQLNDEAASRLIAAQSSPVADNPIVTSQNDDRIFLFGYWWRTGELLDYVLGEPVSSKLRTLPAGERLAAIPVHLRPALLETQYDESFPPTFILHGEVDTTVPLEESLGAQKYLWFSDANKKRPLMDFERFDDAARGPLGALRLLSRTRTRLSRTGP